MGMVKIIGSVIGLGRCYLKKTILPPTFSFIKSNNFLKIVLFCTLETIMGI